MFFFILKSVRLIKRKGLKKMINLHTHVLASHRMGIKTQDKSLMHPALMNYTETELTNLINSDIELEKIKINTARKGQGGFKYDTHTQALINLQIIEF